MDGINNRDLAYYRENIEEHEFADEVEEEKANEINLEEE